MQTAGLPDTFEVSGFQGPAVLLCAKSWRRADRTPSRILWINVYICRELFHEDSRPWPRCTVSGRRWPSVPKAHGFTPHGGRIGTAACRSNSPTLRWFPRLTAAWAAMRGIPHSVGVQCSDGGDLLPGAGDVVR